MIIIALIGVAVFSALLANYGPRELAGPRLAPPDSTFWMGTDSFGRDTYSRLVLGARLSLYVGLVSVTLGVAAGLVVGVVTGYLGGKLDLIGQRVIDSMQALPSLVLALTLVAVLGASVNNVVIAIAITIIPGSARVFRSRVLAIKEATYVDAAIASGASHLRIMVVHVVPNLMAIVFIVFSLDLGRAILAEASLSFLGLGSPPDVPSWGGMISLGRRYLVAAPWLALFPGIAISLTVYAFNLLGDSLRDALDPKLRSR
ncbi:MAG: ABC transporter permease [Chloroflexi bacterium]|nr:ABC transporter permease [Chloroflexota bacterium]